MTQNQVFFDEDTFKNGYPILELKDTPKFSPDTHVSGIDRNGNWNPLMYGIPMLLKTPNFVDAICRNQGIVFMSDVLKYYKAMRKESGNTLFLIRIETMERLTRRLVNDDKLTIVDDGWNKKEFYGYQSFNIDNLKIMAHMAVKLKQYCYSITGKTRPLELTRIRLYYYIAEYHHYIFESMIPNFPLTINKWEIPHWKN